MDTILHAFLSWQFLFFCIALGAAVFVIRQVVEYAMENWWPLKGWAAANSKAKVWRDLILPIMPIILGQVAALVAHQYPYPEGFSSVSGRVVFGLVAGFSSGLIVKLYKSFLASTVADYAARIKDAASPKPRRGRRPSRRDDYRDDYRNDYRDNRYHEHDDECADECDPELERSVRDSIKRD